MNERHSFFLGQSARSAVLLMGQSLENRAPLSLVCKGHRLRSTVRSKDQSLTQEVLGPHTQHERSVSRGWDVLSLGKSQGRSDSVGDYTTHVASVNNGWKTTSHTLPLRFHVPTKIVQVLVVEYSESLAHHESGMTASDREREREPGI